MDLKVTITGKYSVSMTTQNETLSFNAKANKKTAVVLDVTNNGNVALTDINLTASAPTDWTVEFSESSIDSLDAGTTKEVTAYVTPSQSAISGDYVVNMTATAKETSNTSASPLRRRPYGALSALSSSSRFSPACMRYSGNSGGTDS